MAKTNGDDRANLALFRIAVAIAVVTYDGTHAARGFAALADGVAIGPDGFGWVFDAVPPSTTLANGLYVVVLIAAVLGGIGFHARTSFGVLALALAYLLGLPQRTGFVGHAHHLVWFSALLAVSPCADALAVDSRCRRDQPALSRSYRVALIAVWVMVAAIYFFPGFWKLRQSGWAWTDADNLRHLLWMKWAQQPGFEPLFRLDRYPTLCGVAAVSVVAFELSFPFLIPFKRTRPIAALAAIGFHLGTAAFMGLRFSALWITYVAFFDVSRWWAGPVGTAHHRRVAPPLVAGALLASLVLFYGATGRTRSWPFACYPTFQWMTAATVPTLDIEYVDPDGVVRPMARASTRSVRDVGLEASLIGALGDPASTQRLEAHFLTMSKTSTTAGAAKVVRFFRVERATDPDAEGAEVSRRLLHEWVRP